MVYGDQFQRSVDLLTCRNFCLRLLKGQRTVVSVLFPFAAFFADAPQPLFPAESYESDMEIAEGCFRRGFAVSPMWRCDKH
jgi:hypothetical protein